MSNQKPLIIGSRGSMLARWQAEHIKMHLLEKHPDLAVEIQIIKTTGDIMLEVALAQIGDKGAFTKELEIALLNNEVDVCVHSMKDVPTTLPDGLVLGAVPPRATAFDVLVAGEGVSSFADLPEGARIGTGSLRRRAQLFALQRGFEAVELRGNLDTRIKKVEEGVLDAVILAGAGIERLGWQERISAFIPLAEMVPAVGQGALALEMRADDTRTHMLCESLAHPPTELCVGAEREVMRTLDGGCQVPIGAHAWIKDGRFTLCAMVASIDGSRVIRVEQFGAVEAAEEVTQGVIAELRKQGAEQLLREVRAEGNEFESPIS